MNRNLMKKNLMKKRTASVIWDTIRTSKVMTLGLFLTVTGAIVIALLPPLVLEWMIDRLSVGEGLSIVAALVYFGFISMTGLFEAGREILLTIMGQRITREIRHAMNEKITRLAAEDLTRQEPGVMVSRFIGDVDTVEKLFTSGIISMVADLCKILCIFVIVGGKNRGLAVVMLMVLPAVYVFTRYVQKRSLKAQIENRKAVAKVANHVPETIQNIRTIHALEKEEYMEKRYSDYIAENYEAMEKTNFFDSIYSPAILIFNGIITAGIMVLSASGIPMVKTIFGMTVGTSVAMVSYIGQIFGPLESIGMEIQTIQSAIAGVHRIDEFLSWEERWDTKETVCFEEMLPCVELKNVSFSYVEEQEILRNLSLQIETGEHVTLVGRTGAGKSTLFKLLLGMYQPKEGTISIYGQDASLLPDTIKRSVFGYVEQSFCAVPGTLADQIRVLDEGITQEMIESAAKVVGIHDTIEALPSGYETPYHANLLSQGQKQLLSIARAIVARPKILLLDEITANLDADTEQTVLLALRRASQNRTVISISHRLYEQTGGRLVQIGD